MSRLVGSVRETAQSPREVEVVFYIDDDDPSGIAALGLIEPSGPVIQCVGGPRILLSESWNRCYDAARGDILMHCGDDIVFRSPCWDARVRAAFDACPDKILFVHGRDGIHDGAFGTHGFLHRRWVETLGYFCPPLFSCDFNDTWLNALANALGRRVYLPDVFSEHMHPVAGKAEWDRTHAERLERGERDGVHLIYADTEAQRRDAIEKLRAVIVESNASVQ